MKTFINVLIVIAVFVIIGFFGILTTYHLVTVQGNQVGVLETFKGGVSKDPLPPRTYFINRWTENVFAYDISSNVFVMNSQPNVEGQMGRRFDTLEIKSLDNQKVEIETTTRWHRDPLKIIALHIGYRDNLEEKLLRPEQVRLIVSKGTLINAIDLYSGEKLNTLRNNIESDMKNLNGELATKGVVIDSFVIDKVDFVNKDYVNSIEARQLAIAQKSQQEEQAKANLAKADAQKAESQIELNKQVVEAEANKQVQILNQQASAEQSIVQTAANAKNAVTQQEAESQKIILAAHAEAERNVAISEAQKQAEINRSIAILAVGKSEAEANKLKLESYSVAGSEAFVRIQVATQLANAFSGVKGYLPSNMNYSLIGGDFVKSVSLLTNPSTPVVAPSQ